MAGQHQRPPPLGELTPHLAKLAVQLLRLRLFHKALTVGGVGHQLPVVAVAVEGAHIGHLKADVLSNACLAGVFLGQGNGSGVNVAAPNVVLAVELLVLRLFLRLLPAILGEEQPPLGIEAAVKTRRAVAGN